MKPEWIKLGKMLKGGMVYAYEAFSGENSNIKPMLNIQGVPDIRFISESGNVDKVRYSGERSVSGFLSYFNKKKSKSKKSQTGGGALLRIPLYPNSKVMRLKSKKKKCTKCKKNCKCQRGGKKSKKSKKSKKKRVGTKKTKRKRTKKVKRVRTKRTKKTKNIKGRKKKKSAPMALF
jgi:hypothetical protein